MIKHYGDVRWETSDTSGDGIAFDMHDLQNRIDHDEVTNTAQFLIDALKAGTLKPEALSLRQLAECFLPDGLAHVNVIQTFSTETTAPLTSVLGAIIEAKVKEAFTHKDFVLAGLVSTIPSRPQGERVYPFLFTEDFNGTMLDRMVLRRPSIRTPISSIHIAAHMYYPLTASSPEIIPAIYILADRFSIKAMWKVPGLMRCRIGIILNR